MRCNPKVRAKSQGKVHTHTNTPHSLCSNSIILHLYQADSRALLPRANLIIKESRQLKHSHGSERSILHAMIMRSLVMPPSCGKVQLGGSLGTRGSLSGSVSRSTSFIDRLRWIPAPPREETPWLGGSEPGRVSRRRRLTGAEKITSQHLTQSWRNAFLTSDTLSTASLLLEIKQWSRHDGVRLLTVLYFTLPPLYCNCCTLISLGINEASWILNLKVPWRAILWMLISRC